MITPNDKTPSHSKPAIIPLSFPGFKEGIKFVVWSTGRVFGFGLVLFLVDSAIAVNKFIPVMIKSFSTIIEWILLRFKSATLDILKWYETLPVMGVSSSIINVSSRVTDVETSVLPLDLLSEIANHHLMILGITGSGKSILAQYLAYSIGGKLKVYEPEGTPDTWQGLDIYGVGENYQEINDQMDADLKDLTERIQKRTHLGDAGLAGAETTVICEEYPELAIQCKSAQLWLERHARRGRKTRRWVIALSQTDNLTVWKLEGNLEVLKGFKRLRLGKLAIQYAQKSKILGLREWLLASKQHALLDDDPVLIPPYQEMQRVCRFSAHGSLPVHALVSLEPVSGFPKTSETLGNGNFEPFSALQETVPAAGDYQQKLIQTMLDNWTGSDSDLIKAVWGARNYQVGKDTLKRLREASKG